MYLANMCNCDATVPRLTVFAYEAMKEVYHFEMLFEIKNVFGMLKWTEAYTEADEMWLVKLRKKLRNWQISDEKWKTVNKKKI